MFDSKYNNNINLVLREFKKWEIKSAGQHKLTKIDSKANMSLYRS